MKLKTTIIAFSFLLATTSVAQDKIFGEIENKTWFENNEFAGITLVFYKTTNGLLKAIRQINGSGVPVISSGIYDFEIENDTIYLLNGLNLNTSEKLDGLKYVYKIELGSC